MLALGGLCTPVEDPNGGQGSWLNQAMNQLQNGLDTVQSGLDDVQAAVDDLDLDDE